MLAAITVCLHSETYYGSQHWTSFPDWNRLHQLKLLLSPLEGH